MRRLTVLIAAAVMAVAPAAFAQDQAPPSDTEVEGVVIQGNQRGRADSEAISPVTTVGSEQLELTATLTVDDAVKSWEPSSGSRLERRRDRGVSSVRVVRGCEISLTLGDDGDCTSN